MEKDINESLSGAPTESEIVRFAELMEASSLSEMKRLSASTFGELSSNKPEDAVTMDIEKTISKEISPPDTQTEMLPDPFGEQPDTPRKDNTHIEASPPVENEKTQDNVHTSEIGTVAESQEGLTLPSTVADLNGSMDNVLDISMKVAVMDETDTAAILSNLDKVDKCKLVLFRLLNKRASSVAWCKKLLARHTIRQAITTFKVRKTLEKLMGDVFKQVTIPQTLGSSTGNDQIICANPDKDASITAQPIVSEDSAMQTISTETKPKKRHIKIRLASRPLKPSTPIEEEPVSDGTSPWKPRPRKPPTRFMEEFQLLGNVEPPSTESHGSSREKRKSSKSTSSGKGGDTDYESGYESGLKKKKNKGPVYMDPADVESTGILRQHPKAIGWWTEGYAIYHADRNEEDFGDNYHQLAGVSAFRTYKDSMTGFCMFGDFIYAQSVEQPLLVCHIVQDVEGGMHTGQVYFVCMLTDEYREKEVRGPKYDLVHTCIVWVAPRKQLNNEGQPFSRSGKRVKYAYDMDHERTLGEDEGAMFLSKQGDIVRMKRRWISVMEQLSALADTYHDRHWFPEVIIRRQSQQDSSVDGVKLSFKYKSFLNDSSTTKITEMASSDPVKSSTTVGGSKRGNRGNNTKTSSSDSGPDPKRTKIELESNLNRIKNDRPIVTELGSSTTHDFQREVLAMLGMLGNEIRVANERHIRTETKIEGLQNRMDKLYFMIEDLKISVDRLPTAREFDNMAETSIQAVNALRVNLKLPMEEVLRRVITPWLQVHYKVIEEKDPDSGHVTTEEDMTTQRRYTREVPENVDSFKSIVDTIKELIRSIEAHRRGAEDAVRSVLQERLSVFKEALADERQRVFTLQDFDQMLDFARNMSRMLGHSYSGLQGESHLPPRHPPASGIAGGQRPMMFDLSRARAPERLYSGTSVDQALEGTYHPGDLYATPQGTMRSLPQGAGYRVVPSVPGHSAMTHTPYLGGSPTPSATSVASHAPEMGRPFVQEPRDGTTNTPTGNNEPL